MVKINFIANVLGNTSGYVSHGRSLFSALAKQRWTEIFLDTAKGPGWEAVVNDDEMKAIMRGKPFKDGVTIMIAQPQFWQTALNEPHERFYGFVIWEGDIIPKYWVPILQSEEVTGILVPSHHTKQAIINREPGLNDKIHVVPHGVDKTLFKPSSKEAQDEEKFIFLCNKGWAQGVKDRGGVQYLLKAYLEEFKKEEPVSLRLKINMAYTPPGWNFSDELTKIGIAGDNNPEIAVNMENIDYKHMPKFYKGDVFVSPTMSEAFSIPCVEAMACGIPVITTDFGGQTDFVNESNGWIIKTKKVLVEHDMQYEGVQWGLPDIDDLRKAMREAYEDRKLTLKKGRQALKDSDDWTWNKSAEKLLEVVKLK